MVFIIAEVSLPYFGHVLKRDIFISVMHWKNFPKNFNIYLSCLEGSYASVGGPISLNQGIAFYDEITNFPILFKSKKLNAVTCTHLFNSLVDISKYIATRHYLPLQKKLQINALWIF